MIKKSNANYILGLSRWPSLFLCLIVISSCGSTPKQSAIVKAHVTHTSESPYLSIDWPNLSKTYMLADQHGYGTSDAQRAKPVFNTDVVLIGLNEVNGKWQAHIGEEKEGEELAINLVTGRVTLLAEAEAYTTMLGGKRAGLQSTFSSDIHALCYKGLLNVFDNNEGRNLCSSKFSFLSADYDVAEVFIDAVTSLGQATMLTKFYKVKFDEEALRSVLEETNIYQYLINLAADRYYNQFESDYKNAMLNRANFQSFVEKYDRVAQLQNHEYLASAREQARVLALTTADTKDKLISVINKYEGADSDNLLSQAKSRLQNLVDEETKKAEFAKVEAEKKRVKAKRELDNWRKNLRLGDSTFCGRIVELNDNSTMFKLALSAKLPGFGTEQWVHINDLYQPWRGCINQNGNLSPRL
jgi:hypothetical protein